MQNRLTTSFTWSSSDWENTGGSCLIFIANLPKFTSSILKRLDFVLSKFVWVCNNEVYSFSSWNATTCVVLIAPPPVAYSTFISKLSNQKTEITVSPSLDGLTGRIELCGAWSWADSDSSVSISHVRG